MALGKVMHFEIHCEDVDRAAKFYRAAFDWKIEKWGGPNDYWLVTTHEEGTPGINGGMMKRQGDSPKTGAACNAYVCTIALEGDLAQMLERVKTLGAKQVVDTMPIPGVGKLAYCTDTEGNIFGMLEPEPQLKKS